MRFAKKTVFLILLVLHPEYLFAAYLLFMMGWDTYKAYGLNSVKPEYRGDYFS